MYIIPAIDLIKGKCVRLIQGQYQRQITYEDDPVKKAEEFISAGAKWLHIVDLEGARVGRPVNTDAISAIATLCKSQIANRKSQIQVGGGIRDEDAIKQLLNIGVQRVIIGTKAVSDFEWFSQMAKKFRGRIALGLDARGSKVATHGWTKEISNFKFQISNSSGAGEPLLDFARRAAKLPIAAIIYTDITKDGMMAGPNFERTKTLIEAIDVPVIASGGVSTIDDIKKLAELGAAAVIIGRSLYEGTLKLSDAIKAASCVDE